MRINLSALAIQAGAVAARLGSRARRGTRVRLIRGAGIALGVRTRIRRGAVLDARGGAITLGDGACIGPEVTILTGDSDVLGGPPEVHHAPVTIGARAWIGARAIILPGVRIGTGALVATGAVVVNDVAGDTIVAGSPARPVGRRCADGVLEFAAPRGLSTPVDVHESGRTASR